MTVLLGREAGSPDRERRLPSSSGIRTDECWDARRRRYHQSLVPTVYPTWQPAPRAPRHQAWPASWPEATQPASGMMALYARRVGQRGGGSTTPRRAAPHERTLVSGGDGAGMRRRAYAVIGEPRPIGRGSEAHYQALHPRSRPTYSRLRCHASVPRPRTIVFRRRASIPRRIPSVGSARSVLYPLLAGAGRSPVEATRRVAIAMVAALIVLAGAATGGLTVIM